MKPSKNIFNTGRKLLEIEFTVQSILLKYSTRKNNHVGTIMSNRKGLSVTLKTDKGREVLSSEFMWKNNSPVMIVSYCPKPNKKVLLVSIGHGEPDICDAPHRKPIVIDFYNSQRCSVDIIYQMLPDYSCQSTCGSWVFVVLTLILDFAAVNARTILKHNKESYINLIQDFLKNVATYLMIPYIPYKEKVTNLKSVTFFDINDVLES